MDYEIVNKPSFIVGGLSIRTTRKKANQEVTSMWMDFLTKKTKYTMAHAINKNEMLGVYFDRDETYKEDHRRGSYTAMASCKISHIKGLPKELASKVIPAGKYALFTARGKIPNVTIETWNAIYQANIDRAYEVDFELYENLNDPENCEVKIFISIV